MSPTNRGAWVVAVVCSFGGPAGAQQPPARADLSGDPLPAGAVVRLGSVRWHVPAASAVAVSPDGRTVASANDRGVITLWDVATGKERGRFQAHPAYVFPLLFLPDGATLVSAGDDKTVRLWDLATHK